MGEFDSSNRCNLLSDLEGEAGNSSAVYTNKNAMSDFKLPKINKNEHVLDRAAVFDK